RIAGGLRAIAPRLALYPVETRKLSAGELPPRSRVAVGIVGCARQAIGAHGASRLSEPADRTEKCCGAVSQSRQLRRPRPTPGRPGPRLREAARLRSWRQLRRDPLESHGQARPAGDEGVSDR